MQKKVTTTCRQYFRCN